MKQRGFAHLQILLILVIAASIGGVGFFVYKAKNNIDKSFDSANQGAGNAQKADAKITNFEECKAAGNPIQESFPERCAVGDQTFTNTSQKSPAVTPVDDKSAIAGAVADDCLAKHSQTSDVELKSRQEITDSVLGLEANLLRSDGKFAYVSATCSKGPGGGFAIYLKKDPTWKVVVRTQDYPECKYVDGASSKVVPECYDEATQKTRSPKA